MHRFPSLSLKSRIDARWLCDDDLQAKPFSFAAAKNGIGRGPRCRYGRCRRNHSRKMPFRSKFCYISNSSYICIAVPGVPLSDVSADDESGFFSFYKSNTFFGLCRLRGMLSLPVPLRLCSRRAILRCRDDCLQTELFFCAATTVCRRNYSSVPRRLLQTELFFCAGDNPCSDSQIHPLKSGITARKRS